MGRRGTNAGLPRVALALGLCALLTLLAPLLLERDAPPVLVLDLRNNNGGELQEALRASALFFDESYFLPPARAYRAAPFHPPRGGGAEDMTPLCFTANSRGEYTDHDVEEFRTDRLYPRAPAGAAGHDRALGGQSRPR